MNAEPTGRGPSKVSKHIRAPVVALLERVARDLVTHRKSTVLYFQGRGGLGKTFLLEKVAELAQLEGSSARLCPVVDMVDAETRKPLYLERLLIDGMKDNLPNFDKALVSACFDAYERSRREYETLLQHNPNPDVRDAADQVRRGEFLAGWNTLTGHHPLVLRFDTLELLLGDVPHDALVQRDEARVGVRRLLDWLLFLLRGAERTLSIFCGRPPHSRDPDEPFLGHDHLDRAASFPNRVQDNELALRLAAEGLLDAEHNFITLRPLTDPQSLGHYLEVYGLTYAPTEEDLKRIGRITSGSPLLLTLFAECERVDPPALFRVDLETITTQSELESHLIDTILNPLQYRRPDVPGDKDRLTLTLCLYILSYARRGLARPHLEQVLARIDPSLHLTRELLDRLREQALVKTIRGPISGADEDLLYLHDEIWLLIDESGAPDQLGLRAPVLDELCAISAALVRDIPQSDEHIKLIRAMADHVYYAVTRDFAGGYRYYLTYMDHLLGQRNLDDALVLADVFWRMLTLTVMRVGRPTEIYRDMLSEARNLDLATVKHYDRVHYAKLLRGLGHNGIAADEAAALRDELISHDSRYDRVGVDPKQIASWPPQLYLYADLQLAYAQALILDGKTPDYAASAEQLAKQLTGLLDDAARLDAFLQQSRAAAEAEGEPLARDDDLLRLRRNYLLGVTWRMYSQLARQQFEFDEAITYGRAAHAAFSRYREQPLALAGEPAPVLSEEHLNDYVLDDVASTLNNLAYAQAETGNLPGALRLSEDLVQAYAQTVRPYYRALIFNVRAEILLRANRQAEVLPLVEQAEAAAQQANVGRALGLVKLTRARLARWEMNKARERQEGLEDFFQSAVALLSGEKSYTRDAHHEWARALRDLAIWSGEQGEPELKRAYLEQALAQVGKALGLLPEELSHEAVQRADLLETRIAILNNLDRFDEVAAELDSLEATVMQQRMPLYGQVVCGKVALQRALLELREAGRGDLSVALRAMTVAMARCFVYGESHKDQQAFELLVSRWVKSYVPAATYAAFLNDLRRDVIFVGVSDLPYQNGAPLTHRRWNEAWERAFAFMSSLAAQDPPAPPLTPPGA